MRSGCVVQIVAIFGKEFAEGGVVCASEKAEKLGTGFGDIHAS